MIAGDKKGFLVAHYDWIVAGLAALALAAAAVWYLSASGDDDEALAANVRQTMARMSAKTGVTTPDFTAYAQASRLAKTPTKISALEAEGREANFLAAERRVFCRKCLGPMSAVAKACPFCGTTLEEPVKVVYDTDGDGLPDEWEKRFGLNVNDKADAEGDKDGDSFTNAEEFKAGTNPTDPSSHPDYLDSVAIELPLKQTFLPFFFRKAYQVPAGMKLEFVDPKKKNDYGQMGLVYSVLEGEPIGATGYVAKKYEKRSAKRKIKGSDNEKTVDVSTVTVERKSDGKKLELVVEERKRKPVDVQVVLAFSRDGGKRFTVVQGDKIEIHGEKYLVKAVVIDGKKVGVTLEAVRNSRQRKFEALEP